MNQPIRFEREPTLPISQASYDYIVKMHLEAIDQFHAATAALNKAKRDYDNDLQTDKLTLARRLDTAKRERNSACGKVERWRRAAKKLDGLLRPPMTDEQLHREELSWAKKYAKRKRDEAA